MVGIAHLVIGVVQDGRCWSQRGGVSGCQGFRVGAALVVPNAVSLSYLISHTS